MQLLPPTICSLQEAPEQAMHVLLTGYALYPRVLHWRQTAEAVLSPDWHTRHPGVTLEHSTQSERDRESILLMNMCNK
jgi:hypothetical protein